MGAGADLHAEVAHLLLHQPQHGHDPRLALRRVVRDAIDGRAQHRAQSGGHLVEGLGPTGHVAPGGEVAPLDPRPRVERFRNAGLLAQRRHVVGIPDALVEAIRLRHLRRQRAVELSQTQGQPRRAREATMHVGDRHGPLHLELAQAVACEDGLAPVSV